MQKGLWPPKEEMRYCQVLDDRVSRAEGWAGLGCRQSGLGVREGTCGATRMLEDRWAPTMDGQGQMSESEGCRQL